MQHKAFSFFIFYILFLSSCSKSYLLDDKVEKLEQNNYYAALAAAYNKLAQKERESFDWSDADYFADKGLRALSKEAVPAEDPANRVITDAVVFDELVYSKIKMERLLNNDIKLRFPYKSARLQVLYDYWVEQEEENWQNRDINRFREEFWEEYRVLEAAVKLYKAKNNNNLQEVDNVRMINFDFNKSQLDSTAIKVLNNILNYLRTLGQYSLIIEGHSDFSGSDEYNKRLSKNRVDVVKEYLIQNGVSEDVFIHESALGESKPKISKKAGGYRDRVNRRVEIYIIPKDKE